MFRAFALCAAVALPAAAIAAMPMTPKQYVMKAGAADRFEIESSRLVAGSTNPQIREFATKMIHDHTQSTAEVKAAAMKAGVAVMPPMLDPAQQAMIAGLKKVSGSARDSLYIADQKTAHQQALALHQAYAANGTSAPLKMAAAKIVPVVEGHIQMLSTM